MKTAKIIPIAILFLITVTIVSASHTSSISMTPDTWAKNTEKTVSISVTNNGPDNIVKVELLVPKDSNNVPIYSIREITTPQGWTYTTTGVPGYITKITWVATDSGIASGSSLSLFGIDVKSPETSGDYDWSWITTDSKSITYSGTLKTTVGKAPLAYFVISGVPSSSNAGSSFKINVKAYGDDNQIKTDYTGTIHFTSTDPKAILPSDYTFSASDYGSKDFTITYKTAGEQSFTIKDSVSGISKDSIKTLVKPGNAIEITITPQDKKINVGEKVEFKVLAKDEFGNEIDVTNKASITIDKKAGGSWNESIYTSENEGTWVVIASYNSLIAGTTLIVSKVTEVTPKENVTEEVPEVLPEISLSAPESITIAPGANDTTIITVNNNGNIEIKGVEIEASGVPSDWVSVYPLQNDIPAKGSKDYLVIIFVPKNESGTKVIEFKAKAGELTAVKNTSLIISTAPTGIFAMPKNLLQLGVIIIAVAAVVIIGWELWFKKPKSK